MSDIQLNIMQAEQKGFESACNWIAKELERLANNFKECEESAHYEVLYFASHIHDIAEYRKEYENAKNIQLLEDDQKP